LPGGAGRLWEGQQGRMGVPTASIMVAAVFGVVWVSTAILTLVALAWAAGSCG
jgi:hypothetical protein